MVRPSDLMTATPSIWVVRRRCQSTAPEVGIDELDVEEERAAIVAKERRGAVGFGGEFP